MTSYHYDVLVIGAGQGGLPAAHTEWGDEGPPVPAYAEDAHAKQFKRQLPQFDGKRFATCPRDVALTGLEDSPMTWKDRLGRVTTLLTVSIIASAIGLQAQKPPTQTMAVAVDSLLAEATLALRVDGMSCPFCAYGLEKKLKDLEAIDTLVVRISDGVVAIRVKQGRTIADSALHELVDQAGFSLREVVRLERP